MNAKLYVDTNKSNLNHQILLRVPEVSRTVALPYEGKLIFMYHQGG